MILVLVLARSLETCFEHKYQSTEIVTRQWSRQSRLKAEEVPTARVACDVLCDDAVWLCTALHSSPRSLNRLDRLIHRHSGSMMSSTRIGFVS